jgi:hypothetical protein
MVPWPDTFSTPGTAVALYMWIVLSWKTTYLNIFDHYVFISIFAVMFSSDILNI